MVISRYVFSDQFTGSIACDVHTYKCNPDLIKKKKPKNIGDELL